MGNNMNRVFTIVSSKDFDYSKNAYAICECTRATEGVQIARSDKDEFVSFKCPRCGRSLGMFVNSLHNRR